jgi:hypothetical protein
MNTDFFAENISGRPITSGELRMIISADRSRTQYLKFKKTYPVYY